MYLKTSKSVRSGCLILGSAVFQTAFLHFYILKSAIKSVHSFFFKETMLNLRTRVSWLLLQLWHEKFLIKFHNIKTNFFLIPSFLYFLYHCKTWIGYREAKVNANFIANKFHCKYLIKCILLNWTRRKTKYSRS